MRKSCILTIVSIALSVFIFTSAWTQEDMENIDNSIFDNPQRPSSIFNHDEHNEAAGLEDCFECHHVYEDGVRLEDEDSTDFACAECHEKESAGSMPGLMKAYHLNCKGCHQASDAGPIMCGECHKKK